MSMQDRQPGDVLRLDAGGYYRVEEVARDRPSVEYLATPISAGSGRPMGPPRWIAWHLFDRDYPDYYNL